MTTMTESPTVRRINAQVPDTLAHYLAEEQQARFHLEALALLEEAKPYLTRCNSARADELSKTITEFIAQHRRKMP